ncbi:MAG TPA: TrpB-like pyridoxal phosphate-dependent enzyme [Candidatus Deferrimicrobium sp.]|nr:TrpB-like pyridoxal phosphate-dependent enzyme [Candidatus Deferrimicrobium sp.]
MTNKFILDENEMPKQWYNINPDLPKPCPPPIDPGTQQPMNPEILMQVFGKELILQEISDKRYIDIPEEVREIYRLWRPTPLIRAVNLEKMLKTPAKIYYKHEGVSPPGSHKPNTAVAQAYYNMKEGIERISTETGAGQWGSALAFGCQQFGMQCQVYMVRVSYDQKPYRAFMMHAYGAEVVPSPSEKTQFGRKMLDQDPNNPGSLGLAISEAVEDAVTHDNTKYALGSVLNHVLLHQTIIGQESLKQFEMAGDYPDIIFGCIGGGSSFSGMAWPFYYNKITKKEPKNTKIVAVEPTACPSITKGTYMYDHGDTARMTPLVKMYTLGHEFIPPPIHAGGLRYHGKAPQVSLMAKEKQIEVRAYDQMEVFKAASEFIKAEGIIPAPEPSHAIKAVIDEALRCKETGEAKTIFFLLCGHGHFDLAAYDAYYSGKLKSYAYPKAEIEKATKKIKELYPWIDTLPF